MNHAMGRCRRGRAKSKDQDQIYLEGRICDYCGANQDTTDIESLRFLHGDCWKQYRLDGKRIGRFI